MYLGNQDTKKPESREAREQENQVKTVLDFYLGFT